MRDRCAETTDRDGVDPDDLVFRIEHHHDQGLAVDTGEIGGNDVGDFLGVGNLARGRRLRSLAHQLDFVNGDSVHRVSLPNFSGGQVPQARLSAAGRLLLTPKYTDEANPLFEKCFAYELSRGMSSAAISSGSGRRSTTATRHAKE